MAEVKLFTTLSFSQPTLFIQTTSRLFMRAKCTYAGIGIPSPQPQQKSNLIKPL